MTLAEGDLAPAFDLPTDDGKPASSAALKGKPYVIYFYPKDDTPGCTKEAIEFSCIIDRFDALGVPVIGVSKEDTASKTKFRQKYDLKVALAADEAGATVEAFGSWVEKSMYGKKYMGIDRSTFLVGADGRIAKTWRSVKVPDHAEEVLAEATKLVSA